MYENPHVTAGLTLSGLWWALTDGPFGEWCPLSTLSHMLDCQLYGLNPAGHYLTNVLLHAASSVLLFLVLLRMTGDLWPSAWVAAVFAIHPLHVESVAWVAERRDVLSGLFFMLTLGAYALYAERPSLAALPGRGRLLCAGPDGQADARHGSVSAAVARLLAARPVSAGGRPKSTSRIGRWFGRLPVGWRLVVEKIPLMALAAVSCGIVLSTHAAIRSTNPVERLSLVTRLANALVSYAAYLGQSFYPVDLAPFYPHPGTRLPMASVAGALGPAGGDHRGRRVLLAPAALFAGWLAVVFGNAGAGHRVGADRRSCPGRPLYLFEPDRFVDRAGLGRVERLSVATISPGGDLAAMDAGGRVGRGGAAACRRGVASNFLLAQCRDALDAHARLHRAERDWLTITSAYAYAKQGRTEEAIAHLREALAAGSIDRQLIAECP